MAGSCQESKHKRCFTFHLNVKFDLDDNGFITAKEIGSAMKELGEDIPGFRIRIIIEEADKDENGKIDFDEFLRVSIEFLSIFFV